MIKNIKKLSKMTTTKSISKKSVSVETSLYRFSIGNDPKGYGIWAFGIGNKDPETSDVYRICGKYAEAKKQAIAKAAEKGCSRVYVLA